MSSPKPSAALLCAGCGILVGLQLRFVRQNISVQWPWAALALTIGGLYGAGKYARSRSTHDCILSPRATLSETGDLPYPPDAFPGSRDIDSPYGSLRIYEWGPVGGKRVLFVHGISTPCLALGRREFHAGILWWADSLARWCSARSGRLWSSCDVVW